MFRVFQSVRGLADDSVTRLDKNEDLALEMRVCRRPIMHQVFIMPSRGVVIFSQPRNA